MNPAVIFGDVHGDSAKLAKLVKEVRTRFGLGANLYSVGDLIDRGPDSRGVLDICVAEKIKGLLGNHDLWLCSAVAGHWGGDMPYHKIMGGLPTLASYGVTPRQSPEDMVRAIQANVPKEHQEWLLGLPPYRFIKVGNVRYCLVHTGVSVGLQQAVLDKVPKCPEDGVVHVLSQHATDAFFWSGPKPWKPDDVAQFASFTQVFGHTPTKELVVKPGHFIALDTGCGTCPPYALSAVVLLPDGKVETLTIR